MFGHTFLRFDADDVSEKSDWLSYALNFGAVLEKGDNSMLYAYKGLVGAYLKGGSINMGRVVFRQYENESLDLQHVDIIDNH